MILSIFIIFSCIALGIALVGAYSRNPSLYITGGLFLFLLGIIVLNSGLMYKSSEQTNTTYSYTDANLTNTTSTSTQYAYTAYSDIYRFTFGVFMALAGAFSLVHGIVTVRSGRRRDDD